MSRVFERQGSIPLEFGKAEERRASEEREISCRFDQSDRPPRVAAYSDCPSITLQAAVTRDDRRDSMERDHRAANVVAQISLDAILNFPPSASLLRCLTTTSLLSQECSLSQDHHCFDLNW